MTFRPLARPLAVAVPLAVMLVGCTSGDEQTDTCGDDERRNPVSGECDPRYRTMPGDDSGLDTADDVADTAATADTSDAADTRPSRDDTGDETTAVDTTSIDDTGGDDCDRDDDGARDDRCGGPDCDGDDPSVRPDAPEICDGRDNDCDGEADEEIDCSFYAHSQSTLYRIDPFAPAIDQQSVADAPSSSFLDMDTHPSGDLWALTNNALYRLPADDDAWQREGSVNGVSGANGMAIDRRGTAYLTAGNTLYQLDLDESAASYDLQRVGDMGGGYSSSGDCVVNKKGSLLMTSTNPSFSGNDVLVELDQDNGDAIEVGETNHDRIWGLTAGWNKLYGTTSGGELIVIDDTNGASSTVDTFSEPSFYGAASTPASRRDQNE